MNNTNSGLIIGVGSALVDILLLESEAFIAQSGAEKGGMMLVRKEHIDKILASSSAKPTLVPGGSACNTIVGVAKLGGAARFIGKCGRDALGKLFEDDLRAHKVEPMLSHSTLPTGHVLSIVTPDAQRSMLTYLGASSETTQQDLALERFSGAAIVHLEGYLLFNEILVTTAINAAKAAGAKISLDLASYTVVRSSRHILDELVDKHVDILLANEDEAREFTGEADERKALEHLKNRVETAVVKIGKRGSLIAQGATICEVGIMGDGYAKDTTGAGDLWASGFLYGLQRGLSLEHCGKIGAACGFEVCQVTGAAIPGDGWVRIQCVCADLLPATAADTETAPL